MAQRVFSVWQLIPIALIVFLAGNTGMNWKKLLPNYILELIIVFMLYMFLISCQFYHIILNNNSFDNLCKE